MKKKLNLAHLFVLISMSNFVTASEMEMVLEVGRENQLLSASSQDKIDDTEKKER